MIERDLFRHPLAWFIFIILSVASVIYISKNFEKANSLVNVKVSMDREMALEKAVDLANEFSIGPGDFKQAVAFRQDNRFQTFVELEAGGLDTFRNYIEKGNYYPYYWHVRHFKEQEINEASFWFTPDGQPFGFSEKIPETEKRPNLDVDEAQKLAEHMAAYNWDVDLLNYELVEKSKTEQVCGRVDHTFVYERQDLSIGEGKFRIELVVSGDRLSRVNYFVKIPEEFDRRYNEMRSANDTISSIASAIILIIYGLLGVLFGITFLLRKRYLIWKPAVWWGLGIAFASVFLLTLNGLQLSWFGYDTSSSQGNYLFREILGGLMNAFGFGAIIALSVMAAEGLGRIAFPNQIRFWKLWSKDAGSSLQVLGQTIAGYLFAVIILALDVWFYITTTTHFGWWSPAGTLSDPNILANYLPWLDSIATSLQAGFWEEALFRAVPIAGVLILTKNRKSRNIWIILILILQTLIFGAAHANYPNQPSYARVLEMVIPFTIMGIIYIYYGLLPGIIAHYTVDVFWISLPLWVSSTKGIWIDRFMVLIFLFLPLLIVLFRFLKNKKLNEAPESVRNVSWKPVCTEVKEKNQESLTVIQNKRLEKYLVPAACIGMVVWLMSTPFKYDTPKLNVTKGQAVEIAEKEIITRFNVNPDDWSILTSVNSTADLKDIFIWEKGGKEKYRELLNQFLPPSYWNIRFIKKEGPVEERAEEYNVIVTTNGKVYLWEHIWPEAKEGANLESVKAQEIVDKFLSKKFGEDRSVLKEISVSPEKLENRTDWEFIFADTVNYQMETGQGRYIVKLSGEEISMAYPYIYVPEEWIRDYNNNQGKLSVIRSAGQVIIFGILAFGLVMSIIFWTKKRFNTRIFLFAFLFFFLFYLFDSLNSWDSLIAGYQTQLPFSNYVVMMLISLVVSGLFLSLFSSIFLGAAVQNIPVRENPSKYNLIYAVALGIAVYGVFSILSFIVPESKPFFPESTGLNSYLPVFNDLLSGVSGIIYIPALMLTFFIGVEALTGSFRKRKIPAYISAGILGLALTVSACENPVIWIVSGLIAGGLIILIYVFFIRFHFEWLPLVFGIFPVFKSIETIIRNPYNGSVYGSFLLIMVSTGIFLLWYKKQMKQPVK
ncbi:MAG: CPBP family intramembrane metalloprotease [Prolixibacteraceae bacterium]|nr:CPBP family intramembrane metalloprotease [Prolixibacteraceae bacterium]